MGCQRVPSCSYRREAMIEILTFALRVGVAAERFLDVDRLLQTEFAYQQPGLLRRTTGRNDDGRWCVLQVWTSEAAADAGRAALAASALGTQLDAMIDAASVRAERFEGLS